MNKLFFEELEKSIEEVQQLFWNKYYARKPKGYEALRFLLNMNGMYHLQSHKSATFVRDCLCSMLPDDMEVIYRQRHKEKLKAMMPIQTEDEEDINIQSFEDLMKFMKNQQAEMEAVEDAFHEALKKDNSLAEDNLLEEEDDYSEEEEYVESESKKFLQTYTPAKIEAMLNEYIVGQPELVKAVADFLYYHMLRKEHPELPMRNLLVAGSSGTGKTEVFRCVQKLFENIQIKIADGSRVTKEGWTGSYKLKDIINSDLDTLIIDEADKMCKPSFT